MAGATDAREASLRPDTRSHLILSLVPGRGPGPDIKHFRRALDEALVRLRIDTLVADAGYDAEHSHEYAREECGVNTFIPPLIGRPTKKGPSGFWRARMKRVLKRSRYTQRRQAETVNSMLKRLMGSALRARRDHAKCRELHLRALTLNIMIVRRKRVFYGASRHLFSGRSTWPTKACAKIFQTVSDTSLDFSLSVWIAWEYCLCRYARAEEACPECAASRLARNAHRDTES